MSTIIQQQQAPPPWVVWLDFQGTADYEGGKWILRPAEAPEITIIYSNEDILEVTGAVPRKVKIKRGAKWFELRIPQMSSYWKWPFGTPKPALCDNGHTRCLGGIETCCPDQVIGNCVGHWRCPNDTP